MGIVVEIQWQRPVVRIVPVNVVNSLWGIHHHENREILKADPGLLRKFWPMLTVDPSKTVPAAKTWLRVQIVTLVMRDAVVRCHNSHLFVFLAIALRSAYMNSGEGCQDAD